MDFTKTEHIGEQMGAAMAEEIEKALKLTLTRLLGYLPGQEELEANGAHILSPCGVDHWCYGGILLFTVVRHDPWSFSIHINVAKTE